jgi:two-component system response regulator RstA
MSEASSFDESTARKMAAVAFSGSLAGKLSRLVRDSFSGWGLNTLNPESIPLNWIEVNRPAIVFACCSSIDQQILSWLDECRHVGFHGHIVVYCESFSDEEELKGLKHGADFFLNDHSDQELNYHRLQAIVRHLPESERTMQIQDSRLVFGDLVIDNTVREAWLNNDPIELTSAEFDLLWLLSSHAGEVLTREEIFYKLRGIQYDGQDRSVDVRVSRIRPKVGDDPIHPRRIKTIRSKGYLFVRDVDPRPWGH